MTRKAKLLTWAESLGAAVPADATTAQLEQAIEAAIAQPAAQPQVTKPAAAASPVDELELLAQAPGKAPKTINSTQAIAAFGAVATVLHGVGWL